MQKKQISIIPFSWYEGQKKASDDKNKIVELRKHFIFLFTFTSIFFGGIIQVSSAAHEAEAATSGYWKISSVP